MLEPWRWLVDPVNAPAIGAMGFLLSLVGFPITIWQLIRTKRAAQAAKLAADNAKLRMNSFSALRECEMARVHSKSVSDSIANEDWEGVLIGYQHVARSLNDLLLSNVAFDQDVLNSLSKGLEVLENNCSVVERSLKTDPAKLTKGKQFSALRNIEPVISQALFNLERLTS